MGQSGKTQRGLETQARIVAAATDLFLEHGYLGTTMAMIAEEAEVSVQTLYLAFGSKAAIIKTVHDVMVVGDHGDVPLLERPWVDTVRDEANGATALKMVVDNVAPILAQTSPIFDVLHSAAADRDIADLLADLKGQLFVVMHEFAKILDGKKGLNAEVTAELAGDILYAILSIEVHRLLVTECGWAYEEWVKWLHDAADFRLVRPK